MSMAFRGAISAMKAKLSFQTRLKAKPAQKEKKATAELEDAAMGQITGGTIRGTTAGSPTTVKSKYIGETEKNLEKIN
jgi:hypothetical protein